MRNISFNTVRANWPGIVAILALFLGGTSTYSTFIKSENRAIERENSRIIDKVPAKFSLEGYYVDVVWSYDAITTDEGVPNVRYKRDLFQQSLYVVSKGWPTTNWLEEHYFAPLTGFKPTRLLNIRRVSDVRKGEKTPIEPQEPPEK